MKTTSTFILCCFFLLTSFVSGAQYNIVGPSAACTQNVIDFSMTGNLPTTASIYWETSDGTISLPSQTNISINFTTAGIQTVTATILDLGTVLYTEDFEISISELIDPNVIVLGEHCSVLGKNNRIEAISVCENKTITIELENGSNCGIQPNGFMSQPQIVNNGNCSFDVTFSSGQDFGQLQIISGQQNCISNFTIPILVNPTPVAEITTIPEGNPIEVCTGQQIFLSGVNTQTSTLIELVREADNCARIYGQWDITDGTSCQGNSITHSFSQPGTYSASYQLFSTAGCSSNIETVEIIVSEGDSPTIECISTLCESATSTYFADLACDYTWVVEGGSIIGPPDASTVVVEWNGESPIGELILTANNCEGGCSATVYQQVPIIIGEIDGPPVLSCSGNYTYSAVSLQPGVSVTWRLEPESIEGITLSTLYNGNARIAYNDQIDVPEFDLILEISSPFYDCELTSVLHITPNQLNEAELVTPPFVCLGSNLEIEILNVDPVDLNQLSYFVRKGGNTFVEGAVVSSPFIIPLNTVTEAGNYFIEISNSNSDAPVMCGTENAFFRIIDPLQSIDLIGSTVACPNETNGYEIESIPGFVFDWSIVGGETPEGQTDGTGTQFEVVWQQSGLISVTPRNDALNCIGEPTLFNIIVEEDLSEIVGPSVVCANTNSTFEFIGSSARWSTNNPILSSISPDQIQNVIDVYWNNVAVDTQITLTVEYEFCGETKTISHVVNVVPSVEPTISGPSSTCANSEITLLSSVQGNDYQWSFNGEIVSTEGPEATFTIDDESISEPGLYNVELEVEEPLGCKGRISAFYTIYVNPAPYANITSEDPNCPACEESNTYHLVGLEQPLATNEFTYQWFKDGVLLPSYTDQREIIIQGGTAVHGIYTLQVTNNTTTCATISNPFVIDCNNNVGIEVGQNSIEWGLSNIPGQMLIRGTVSSQNVFVPDGILLTPDCEGENGSTDISELEECIYSWTIIDPIYGETTYDYGPGIVFEHQFLEPGYYPISFRSICPTKEKFHYEIGSWSDVLIVPYIPDVIIDQECATAPSNVTLLDNTSYLPAYASQSISWVLTDSENNTFSSGGSEVNTQLSEGEWNVQMSIDNTPNSSLFWLSNPVDYVVERNLEIKNIEATITTNDIRCEQQAILFDLTTNIDVRNVTWYFEDGSSFIGSEVYKTFYGIEGTELQNIVVEFEDVFGCAHTESIAIELVENILELELDVTLNACPGTPIEIEAVMQSGDAQFYEWSTGETTSSIESTGGNISLEVWDANFCRAAAKTIIEPLLETTIEFDVNAPVECEGSSFVSTLTYVEGANYYWNVNGSTVTGNNTYTTDAIEGENSVFVQMSFPDLPECGTLTYEHTFIALPIDELPVVDVDYNCEAKTVSLFVNNYITGEVYWPSFGSYDAVLNNVPFLSSYIVASTGECPNRASVYLSNTTDISNQLGGCYEFCSSSLSNQPVYLPLNITTSLSSWVLVQMGSTTPACDQCQGSGIPSSANILLTPEWESGYYQVIGTSANGCSSVSQPMYLNINDLSYIDFESITCDDLNADGSYSIYTKINSSFSEEEIVFESASGTVEIVSIGEESDGVRNVELTYLPTEEEGEHCIQLTATNDNISCSDETCFELPNCCFNGSMVVLEAECIGDGYFTFLLEVTNNGANQNIELDLLSDDNLFDVFSVSNQSFPSPNILPNGVSTLLVTASYDGSCSEDINATVQLHLVQIDCIITEPLAFECCQTPCNDLVVDVDCSDAEEGVVTLTVVPPVLAPNEQITYEWVVNDVVVSSSNTITLSNAEQSTYSVEITISDGETECKTTLEGVIDCIPCSNVTFPGVICCNQTICEGGSAEFTFTQMPTGGEGELTYMWRLSGNGMPDVFYQINSTTFVLNDYLTPGEYAIAACVAAEGCTFLETAPVELIVEECDPCDSEITVDVECSGPNTILTAYVDGQIATLNQINYWQVADILYPAENPLTVSNEAGSSYVLVVEFEVEGAFCSTELTGLIDCESYDCQNEPTQCGSNLNATYIAVQEAGGYTYISSPALGNETFMVKLYEECVYCSGDITSEPMLYFSENGEVELDFQLSDLLYGSIEIYSIKEEKCELIAASCFIDLQEEKKSLNEAGDDALFTLFPNPTSDGQVFINYRGASNPEVLISLEITDAKGRSVQTHRLPLNGLLAVDVSLLNAGVYFISLTNKEDQQLFLERLVLLK